MQEQDVFRRELWAFVGRRGSKTEAAAALSITRTDLYRYLAGTTEPRHSRRTQLIEVMKAARANDTSHRVTTTPSAASKESVTLLRDTLLHLVSLLDLDLASRAVNE